PQPLNDCYAATEWVHQNAASLGADPKQLIVCGESAGGNLAAAVSLMARDRNGPSITTQLLIYPMITSTPCDAAYNACLDRHFITKEGIQFMWGAYLQSPENAQNPYASLDCAKDLTRLPSAVIVTAEYDPLCQEGAGYADSLRKAGIDVRYTCIPEAIHGCLDLPIYSTEQKIAWAQEIRAMLSNQ
ncbi:MAG: alpha/beta hydrolase, partial [Chlamydiota bacterium]